MLFAIPGQEHIQLPMTSSVCTPIFCHIVTLDCCLWHARQHACADYAHAYTTLVRLLAAYNMLRDMQEQPTYDKKQFMGWAKVSDMHRTIFSCMLMEGWSVLQTLRRKADSGVHCVWKISHGMFLMRHHKAIDLLQLRLL